MRVRGLKRAGSIDNPLIFKSHPMRVRGLKLLGMAPRPLKAVSHPMRVRGLKHFTRLLYISTAGVAPHAGAWIETNIE